MSDEEFATGGDVSEKVYPIRAGEVKKGMIVLLKGFPCKVIEVTTSKTGKHGHAKVSCSVSRCCWSALAGWLFVG